MTVPGGVWMDECGFHNSALKVIFSLLRVKSISCHH